MKTKTNDLIKKKKKELYYFKCPVCGKEIEHINYNFVCYNADIHLRACKIKNLKKWEEILK